MKRLMMMGMGAALLLGTTLYAEEASPAKGNFTKSEQVIPDGAVVLDEAKLPRCFIDKNKDNICDKSVLVGGKCGRKHVKRVPAAKKPEVLVPSDKTTTRTKKLGCVGCGRCLLGLSCVA